MEYAPGPSVAETARALAVVHARMRAAWAEIARGTPLLRIPPDLRATVERIREAFPDEVARIEATLFPRPADNVTRGPWRQ